MENKEKIPMLESTIETVEMTEVDGIQQGAVLSYIDRPGKNQLYQEMQLHTCAGDLYVIVNALRDYTNVLERAISEWGLVGLQKELFSLHAARYRKIADKFAEQMGYDYDKAMERCRKRRERGQREDDTGMDALEALVRKRRNENKTGKGK